MGFKGSIEFGIWRRSRSLGRRDRDLSGLRIREATLLPFLCHRSMNLPTPSSLSPVNCLPSTLPDKCHFPDGRKRASGQPVKVYTAREPRGVERELVFASRVLTMRQRRHFTTDNVVDHETHLTVHCPLFHAPATARTGEWETLRGGECETLRL